MMNKFGNAILKDLKGYVKKFYFETGSPLTIEYVPIECTTEFINGQSFLYNFLKEEFYNKIYRNYKLIFLGVNFEINNITVVKTDEIKTFKIDNEKLYEQLKEILE